MNLVSLRQRIAEILELEKEVHSTECLRRSNPYSETEGCPRCEYYSRLRSNTALLELLLKALDVAEAHLAGCFDCTCEATSPELRPCIECRFSQAAQEMEGKK